jgi:hypothetical protein
MEWKLVKAEIWLSSVDMAWERECDGIHQRLHVICDDKEMHAYAATWMLFDKRRVYQLNKIKRRFVISQYEITGLWNEVYFNGQED